MSFGSRIKQMREKQNYTQTELANKLYVTDKTISSWESDRTEPSLEMIIKLSETFECSLGYLLYGNTQKNDIEIEIKVKTSKDEYERINNLMKRKAIFIQSNHHFDTYYQPTYRKFINSGVINESLRIGERGNKIILNYKKYNDGIYRDEYEVEIDDKKNLDKIFKILGLEEFAVVKKIRNTYLYLDKYEVALDYVENLGYFVELEVKKYTEDIKKEYDALLSIIKDLNLSLHNIEKESYLAQIISKKNID